MELGLLMELVKGLAMLSVLALATALLLKTGLAMALGWVSVGHMSLNLALQFDIFPSRAGKCMFSPRFLPGPLQPARLQYH